jgi:hypothetical protein
MWRLLPILFLLAACASGTTYSAEEDAKDTCDGLGYKGEEHAQCMKRRQHEDACRKIENSRDSSQERARRKAELRCE